MIFRSKYPLNTLLLFLMSPTLLVPPFTEEQDEDEATDVQ